MVMSPPEMKNSYQRKDFGNPVIQIVLVTIILVIFSWFILRPKYDQAMQSRAHLKTAQTQLAQIEQDQVELNKLINELRSSPEDVALVDEALPLSGRISKVYVLLDNLVRSSGMTVSLISTADSTDLVTAGNKTLLANPYQPGRSLHTMTISADITGSMDQFRNFLQLVETNGRVLDIESVDIVGGETETNFRITLNAYAYETVTNAN